MTEEKKSGLAKVAAILAIVFVVSLGLCGANFVALSAGSPNGAQGLLFVTAYLELAGMAVGAGGLLVVGAMAIIRSLIEHIDHPPTKESDSISIIQKDEDK